MRRHSRFFALLAAALILPVGAMGADDAKPKPSAAAAKAAKDVRQCPMPSSPRLQKKKDECAEAKEGARWYSNGDLKDTGQIDTAEALKQLDPRVF
jgi:hypothetical protein